MSSLDSSTDSLSNFKRQTATYLEQLRKSGEPLVLTVNGKAQLVVQDAEAYQKLIAAATKHDQEETLAAIREGLEDVAAGRTKPAREVVKALANKYGLAPLDG